MLLFLLHAFLPRSYLLATTLSATNSRSSTGWLLPLTLTHLRFPPTPFLLLVVLCQLLPTCFPLQSDHGTRGITIRCTHRAFCRTCCLSNRNCPLEACRHCYTRSVQSAERHERELISTDYVHQLREHCRPGLPPSDPEAHRHYLDLVGYWQDQCQRAQEECDRLRSVNIRLERSNQQLAQRTNAHLDERPSTATAAPKRTAPASPSRAHKRARPSTSKVAEQSVAATQDTIDHDYDFLESLGDGEFCPMAHEARRDVTTVSLTVERRHISHGRFIHNT
jgi:hypothetical protein